MNPIGWTIGISLALWAHILKCPKEAIIVDIAITNPDNGQWTIKYHQKTCSNKPEWLLLAGQWESH